jgi:hypothetical protein
VSRDRAFKVLADTPELKKLFAREGGEWLAPTDEASSSAFVCACGLQKIAGGRRSAAGRARAATAG